MKKVVITGLGAVSAAGDGAGALWSACLNGVSGVREVAFDALPDQKVKFAAPLPDALTDALHDKRQGRFQDRIAQMARHAAREAVAQAGLVAEDFGSNCGVVFGSGFGGAETLDRNYMSFGKDNRARLDPMSIPKIMTNASASWLAMEFGARGPAYCVSTACSSAGQSIGLAWQMVASGQVARCIAGGAEACLVPGTFRAWELLRVMTPDYCRPFSAGRNGMVLGEGAGAFILESEEAAKARGAVILAEIAGFGTTCDAGDLLRPDPEGAAEAMRKSLAASGLSPEEIGYVNAHGTATVANDIAEAEAFCNIFGEGGGHALMSSTKPVHGHALGAAGALELVVAYYALKEQIAPPTMNYQGVDPKIAIDPVSDGPKTFDAPATMSNSFAFGGINASLILRRPR